MTNDIEFNKACLQFFMKYKTSIEKSNYKGQDTICVTHPNPQIIYPRKFMGFRVGIRKKQVDLETRFINKYGSFTKFCECRVMYGEAMLFVQAYNKDFSFPHTFEGIKVGVLD